MKVLWFTTSSLNPKLGKHGYNGGGWTAALQVELKKHGVKLALACCVGQHLEKFEDDGFTYYFIERPIKKFRERFAYALNPKNLKYEKQKWDYYISEMQKIVDDYKPDVIEIFGSEQPYGLICGKVNVPVIIHQQGVLTAYHNAYLLPGMSLLSYTLHDWNPKHIWSRYQMYMEWYRETAREREILKNCRYFIGRTDWDKACTDLLSTEYKYYYGSEMLRAEFYQPVNRTIPDKLTIITTSSAAIYKGYDIILKTAQLLKAKLGDRFTWKVFGNVDYEYFEKELGFTHKDVNVELCGVATAQQLKDAISQCTLYFHPSYIENSPNSVCEAQVLGCPVVACHVGGVSTLVEHNKSGFLVPANDPYISAYRIMQIHQDRELNKRLGNGAKEVASERHSREGIVNGLLDIYNKVIEDYHR